MAEQLRFDASPGTFPSFFAVIVEQPEALGSNETVPTSDVV
jgi:hypothetical protein